MTFEEYYGPLLDDLRDAERGLLGIVAEYPTYSYPNGVEPVLYCKSRIKRPESMMRKLESRGLPTDSATALSTMHDAVGARVVCSFLDDVYRIAGWLGSHPALEVAQTKDYIARPKPNGYRSLHLIVEIVSGPGSGTTAEVQLRTIALDFWAALEHQLKYKRSIPHERTIRGELKRCSDEIASVDVSMQTLRDLILDDQWG